MAEQLRVVSKEQGLIINNSKTSCMTVHGEGKIRIEDEEIGNVDKFKFLGSYITPEGDS